MKTSLNKEKTAGKPLTLTLKAQNIQKNHLKVIATQKQSLAPPKKPALINRSNYQAEQAKNLSINGCSLNQKKPASSANKYSFQGGNNGLKSKPKSPIPIRGRTSFSKPPINPQKARKTENTPNKVKLPKEEVSILRFGEILDIYEQEDKNVNINDEIEKILGKLAKSLITQQDLETLFGLDWFDVKSSNSFEVLIDKLIELVLAPRFQRDFRGSLKRTVCFILNGIEEFMFFQGISPSIFANFTALPFAALDLADILTAFLLRNTRKLYFFNEEKLEFLLKLFILSMLQADNQRITDTMFSDILQVCENLLRHNHVRNHLFKTFNGLILKVFQNCRDLIVKPAFLLQKRNLLDISFILICLRYPDSPEKLQREEFVMSLLGKMNSSMKLQREFPYGIVVTFKKIRKIIGNYKLLEQKMTPLEVLAAGLAKMNLKGVMLAEANKTLQKIDVLKRFLIKK